jgi:hypothetical protein
MHRYHILFPCEIFDILNFKELADMLLFKLIRLLFYFLQQPRGKLYLRNRVHAVLKGCWDHYNFKDGACKSLLIVVPINNAPEVELSKTAIASPLLEELFLNVIVSVEDRYWDGSFSN